MKIRGSDIVVKALEDEGVLFAFGIPGTHNTELYDALERSETITPVLVTDEQCASFAADGVSRTSDSLGVVNVVPGAGVTHCLSGVGEAFMDNIPLLVLTCGIRTDTGKVYQLHDVDQLAILKPITKGVFKPESPDQIYSVVRQACGLARSGTPGPVAVEIPANFYLLTHDVILSPSTKLRAGSAKNPPSTPGGSFGPKGPQDDTLLDAKILEAARLINEAKFPAIYAGFGARHASESLIDLAELLQAPVATTIQGKGVFPESHPLWLWNGFGNSAPKFVNDIMNRCDCLIAIGCRFGEVATASYGLTPPENLIHVDINPDVFDRNYKARLAVASDARVFIKNLIPHLTTRPENRKLEFEIAEGHKEVRDQWAGSPSQVGVTPFALFESLQKHAGVDAIYSTDSGNGTFLAMEHLRLDRPGCFIGPIDYSCMGYSVPAAIGAKFAHPHRDVIALAGDGALLMTGLELLTAASYKRAPAVFVLRDGELAQIAQFQRTTLNRETCSVLHPYSVEAFAKATNSRYFLLSRDDELEKIVPEALAVARNGCPVMIEVKIDYTRKTYFTKGVVTTNFWRLPWSERLRMLSRVVARHLSPKPSASKPLKEAQR